MMFEIKNKKSCILTNGIYLATDHRIRLTIQKILINQSTGDLNGFKRIIKPLVALFSTAGDPSLEC